MMQVGMLDIAFVDEEILLATGLFGELGFDDIAVDAHTVSVLVDRQQFSVVVVAKEPHNTLLEVARI